MIEIQPGLTIDDAQLQYDFIRSSGPGGQNVNKVATAVQLRVPLAALTLPGDALQRLRSLARNRITATDELVIEARRYRSQEQNRADALQRLVTLLQKAAVPPTPRRKTRPTAASQAERIEQKKRRGAIKRTRKVAPRDLD
jgi:ribosome-associated protein